MACCSKPKVYSQSDPLIMGSADSSPAVFVIASVNVGGLRSNNKSWVSGSHVPALIAQGWLKETS